MNHRRSQDMGIFIFLFFCLSLAEGKRYQGYQLLKVVPETDLGLNKLKDLAEKSNEDVDFWIPPTKVNRSAECLMSPSYLPVFTRFVGAGIKYTVLNKDIHSAIMQEKESSILYSHKPVTSTYATIDKIVDLIKSYANLYSHASLKYYGKSFEGRDLYGIKFSVGPGRKTIIVEAGMHSREWIAIAATLKVIERFATKRNDDPEVTELLETYDWLFIPVTNPDGYHTTHTADRMWRKNMNSYNQHCIGTDLNRNFDALWGGEGASSNPCHSTYRGDTVFSEPESRNLAKLVRNTRNKIAFFSVHAYSQLILTPYGCKREKPEDTNHLTQVAQKARDAIFHETGKQFIVGTPPDILYPATGGAYDWAKMKMNIKYAYAFELRPEPHSHRGFILPESEIEPSYRELFVALKTFAQNFKK